MAGLGGRQQEGSETQIRFVCRLTLQKIRLFVATFSTVYSVVAAFALTDTVECNP